MSHFGVVTPAFYSHFQAFQALAVALIERGHRVTFFHQADARQWLSDPRIGFYPLGANTHPPGSLDAVLRRAAAPTNPLGLRRVIKDLSRSAAMFCNELPAALAHEAIDALLCDQMEAAGGLVAEALKLPFVSVACALPVNREPQLPLPVMPFAYGTDPRSQRLYDVSCKVYDWLMRPLRIVLHDASRRLAVRPRDGFHQYLSPFAQISQTLDGFDFPREHRPAHFHTVGPLRAPPVNTQGDWSIDPERPFVFASLGTLQGARLSMFKQMAMACRALDAQLLIAHCGGLDAAQEQQLLSLGATWVTDFAPQQWVLQHADAVITHGGLNTVMDAIAANTPMLVMPIAFDQPGVAARVSYRGAGLQLGRRARAPKIRSHLQRVLAQSREPLQRLASELHRAGGVARAADIIEQVLSTGQPVFARTVHEL
ncbi:glycosyltransferase, MGT family [Pseudomonas syringae]|uniref:nucleotide disphospho-sugar-binding domain-containing protein n=1 Tax=Pseudomonas syringae TaxID=317 RepID=UPI000899E0C6|nr:nucleotide disphospho-sugar-binding domain-containing protein [Pseudomonas syringae]SDW75378.1 glycosyltransferase, MGT family [Pseudomonas syringae]SFL94504.1 glycosyltransferase, MGT family [Pseudomonas syringae]